MVPRKCYHFCPMEKLENPRSSQQYGKQELEQFLQRLGALPVLTPREIYHQLEELGYRGQQQARRAVSLMAYRHLRRIRRIYLEGHQRQQVMPKSNYLLVGPTGCGKTFLVELLFGQILKLPTVVVDVTTCSETGYVGQDPNTVLTRLLHAADDSPLWASVGIVCLDEFDKLASSQNNAVFAGAGTTKDVTGLGVQRELLKMLESSEVVVPLELTHSTFGDYVVLPTEDISFIAAGAFSGLPQLLRRRGVGESIGFGSQAEGNQLRDDAIAVSLRAEELEAIAHFTAYGFLPELLARFTRILPFEALSAETLHEILELTVLHRMHGEFADEGLELELDSGVLDWVVQQSLRRETGARGLASILTRILEDTAFETFAGEEGGKVVVEVVEGEVVTRRV